MLYDVRMTTTYEYGRTVTAGRHLVRLMPAQIPQVQRVIGGSLGISPTPQGRHEGHDFFGNETTELVFAEPHGELELTVRARVERMPAAAGPVLSPSLAALRAELLAHRSLDAASPHHFLAPSPKVAPDAAIGRYARSIAGASPTVFDAVKAVNEAIHDDMRYDPEATTVDTPMIDAFTRRRGVCQDFSHVMIACLRELGIPAGYVSGLLRTEPPKGMPRLEGADAMHAWVMAWCGAAVGWVELDPTNAILVGVDHIVVARGRDYFDVAPVRGVLRTAGSQWTKQVVDVVPLA